MLHPTHYTISDELLQQAQKDLPNLNSRLVINDPTGSFFNDPWELKSQYKGTIWEELYNSLPLNKGEARLIKLRPGEAYPSHADIDDRWHLSITGNRCFLIDLENEKMHTVETGIWYSMDAGRRHTAANFGNEDRVQLVVRHLLPVPNIQNPKNISITLKQIVIDRRFIFDDIVSPWLNYAYKKGIVDNFQGRDLEATFTVEESYIPELERVISSHFNLSVK